MATSTMEYVTLPAVFVGSLTVAYLVVKSVSSMWGSSSREIHRPPSLRSLPLVGSIPFLPKDFTVWHIYFMQKSFEMGKIIGLRIANRYSIVLNGRDTLSEALVKQSLHFSGRADLYLDKIAFNKNRKGILGHPYNAEFRRQHQLVLSILKEFGFGKDVMEKRIQEQVILLNERISSESGEPFSPRTTITTGVFNVILSIMAGHCYSEQDVEDVIETLHRFVLESVAAVDINFLPALQFLPWKRRLLDKLMGYNEHLLDCFARFLDKCTDDSFVRHYIDREGPALDREQLLYTLRDLLLAGSETSSTTLQWAIVLLAGSKEGREIQTRMRNEIDSVVPRDRLPSLADKPSLPYVEACMLELMRFKTIVPLAVLHETTSDSHVNGLFIPAGTWVLPNLYSAHMDPTEWKNPEQFQPDRFLDEHGKVVGKERVVSFSMGRRSCLGELLARQEIFLFLTGLVQQFVMEPPVGSDTIDCHEVVNITVSPSPYKVRCIRRQPAAD